MISRLGPSCHCCQLCRSRRPSSEAHHLRHLHSLDLDCKFYQAGPCRDWQSCEASFSAPFRLSPDSGNPQPMPATHLKLPCPPQPRNLMLGLWCRTRELLQKSLISCNCFLSLLFLSGLLKQHTLCSVRKSSNERSDKTILSF